MVLYVNTIFITKLLFWMKHGQMDKLNKVDLINILFLLNKCLSR